MSKASEFIQQHNGDLTPEQAAQLLELVEQGDTGAPALENGGEPDATTAQDGSDTVEQEANAQDGDQGNEGTAGGDELDGLSPENAVVLAKDGKHIIPFERLQQARDEKQEWRAKAEAALAELESYKASAQERQNQGEAPTTADVNAAIAEQAIEQGVDPEIFGDFSEEALAKGVKTLARMEAQSVVREIVEKELAPLRQQQEQARVKAHFDAILAVHPDLDSIMESKQLDEWIESQPSFVRDGYREVMRRGSPQQAIELLDAYKKATGLTQQPKTQDLKGAARAAVQNAQAPVPTSLSDIPGATAGPASPFDGLRNMDPVSLAERMARMTPEQIEHYLSQAL